MRGILRYGHIAPTIVASLVRSGMGENRVGLPTTRVAHNSTPCLRFHHRAYHNSIVVGKYLYIDGGEVTTWNGTGSGFNSDIAAGNITSRPDFNTYSIDLSSSWTNKSVMLNAIPKIAPSLNLGALWLGEARSSFYAYNGGLSHTISFNQQPSQSANQLWQFTPSGSSGKWCQVYPASTSNFTTLKRGYHGAYTSGGGLGFALGGIENAATNEDYQKTDASVSIPGVIVYNFTSQQWYNISASGYSYSGTATDSAAHFVPSFGPAGLLFVFGGNVADDVFPSFDTVSMFDPVSQQWSAQEVSGTKPTPAVNSCVIGLQGDDDTYEIFLYGGLTDDQYNRTISQGAVFVLSLPAFSWQRQNIIPEYGRFRHSCNVVGNRQMAVIGGQVASRNSPDNHGPDPWNQGLGIFDLTAMQWQNEYNASADPYVTPEIVKTYYRERGRFPSSWSSPIVQHWFNRTATNMTSHGNSTNFPLAHQKDSHGSDARVIVGSTAGGVAAVVLVGLVVFLIRQRQRQRRGAEQERLAKSDAGYRKPELQGNGVRGARSAEYMVASHLTDPPMNDQVQTQLRLSESAVEAAGVPVYEM